MSNKTMTAFLNGELWPELSGSELSKDNINELAALGTCARCGRRLTDPKSVAIGMGPDCALKDQAEKPSRERKALEAAGQFTLSYFTAPELCQGCKWLAGPKCGRGITFPGKKGTCKRREAVASV